MHFQSHSSLHEVYIELTQTPYKACINLCTIGLQAISPKPSESTPPKNRGPKDNTNTRILQAVNPAISLGTRMSDPYILYNMLYCYIPYYIPYWDPYGYVLLWAQKAQTRLSEAPATPGRGFGTALRAADRSRALSVSIEPSTTPSIYQMVYAI